jgi:hypothetical protein
MAEVSATPQAEVKKIGQKWDGPNSCARDLGRTWKVRPCITVPKRQTATLMDVDGPGVIQHIWITVDPKRYRDLILRMYWDGEKTPSVESPLGDFFCNGWKTRTHIVSLPINVNPAGAFNCYFPMPFRKHARITVENRAPDDQGGFFYAINYALTEIEKDDAYFHAQFRRTNPLACKDDYVILDGDKEFPTICGTGTEDYFGGAWGFGQNFTAPFLGYAMGSCDGKAGNRHGLYRFHIMDPIRFGKDLRVIMQAIGWRSEGRYLPLQDDMASVAYWYQTEPHAAFPKLGDRDALEVI